MTITKEELMSMFDKAMVETWTWEESKHVYDLVKSMVDKLIEETITLTIKAVKEQQRLNYTDLVLRVAELKEENSNE